MRAVPNPALVAVFREHLLDEFEQRELHDPWWWPTNDGRTPGDWGLPDEITLDSRLRSLMGVDPELRGFPGSLAAKGEAVAVYVGSRPSMGAYPNGSDSRRRFRFLCDVFGSENLASGHVHITDAIKFRWPTDDNRGLDIDMWCASLRCLRAELAQFERGPLLLAKAARAWLADAVNRRAVLVPSPVARRQRVRAELPADLVEFAEELLAEAGAGVPSMYAIRSTKGGRATLLSAWRSHLRGWDFQDDP